MPTLDRPVLLKGLFESYSNESIEKSILQKEFDDFIEKSRGAQIGEIRTWGGEQYVKHADGWVHIHKKTGKVSVLPTSGTVRKIDGNDDHKAHYSKHISEKNETPKSESNDSEKKYSEDEYRKHLDKVKTSFVNAAKSKNIPGNDKEKSKEEELADYEAKKAKFKQGTKVSFMANKKIIHGISEGVAGNNVIIRHSESRVPSRINMNDVSVSEKEEETPPTKVGKDGTKRWIKNGQLHRENGPAVEYSNGAKEWYKNGQFHREDGPAVEYSNGMKEWYNNGQRHREDGPAVEYPDGSNVWYKNGQLHREDGPAVDWADGTKKWYKNGTRWYKN